MDQPDLCDTPAGRTRGQGGFSMVEILVAIAVVAVLLMGVIAGFFTTVNASKRAEQRSRGESVLASMGERTQAMTYRPCATLAQMRADVAALPHHPGYVIAVADIAYLGAAPTTANAAQTFGPTCTTDRGAQRITLTVRRDIAGSPTFRGQVVLRDPTAVPT